MIGFYMKYNAGLKYFKLTIKAMKNYIIDIGLLLHF